MKIIDRYLFRSLLTPLGYCITAFVMIFIVYDLSNNFGDFIRSRVPPLTILRYYLLLLPSILIYLVPVSLMISTFFALARLTKANEVTALRASGVSLTQMLRPFLVFGVLVSLGMAAMHETLGPYSAYWTDQFIKGRSSVTLAHTINSLPYMNEKARRGWIVGEFNQKTFAMKDATVIQQRPDGSDDYKIVAEHAEWLDGKWWFSGTVKKQYYDVLNMPMKIETLHNIEMPDYAETPQTFLNEIKPVEFLSVREIENYLHTHRNISNTLGARLRVNLHNRLAMPWTCLVVMLIGVPFGVQMGRRGAFVGIISALALLFAYYFFSHVSLWAGKNNYIAPWLAGWGTNALFFAVATVMTWRMR